MRSQTPLTPHQTQIRTSTISPLPAPTSPAWTGTDSLREADRPRLEQSVEGDHALIELARTVFVLFDHGPVQADAGKYAASARVGEHLRPHLPIRVAFRMPAHRPRGYRGVGTELKLAREQVLHPVVVHDEHDEIDCLAADLKTDAAARDDEK